jgi:hypothetical protein
MTGILLATPASAAPDAAPAGKAAAPWMPAVKASEATLMAKAMNRTLLILLLPTKEANPLLALQTGLPKAWNSICNFTKINNTRLCLFYN